MFLSLDISSKITGFAVFSGETIREYGYLKFRSLKNFQCYEFVTRMKENKITREVSLEGNNFYRGMEYFSDFIGSNFQGVSLLVLDDYQNPMNIGKGGRKVAYNLIKTSLFLAELTGVAEYLLNTNCCKQMRVVKCNTAAKYKVFKVGKTASAMTGKARPDAKEKKVAAIRVVQHMMTCPDNLTDDEADAILVGKYFLKKGLDFFN